MSGGDPVLDALENPVDAPRLAQAGDAGPDLSHDDGDGMQFERPPFPLGGPVKCLGIMSGMDGSIRCFYLDVKGQLVGLDAHNKHGKNGLIGLYGDQSNFLEANWSQWSKPRKERDPATNEWHEVPGSSVIVGFDQAKASRAHIEECSRRGIFDPSGKIRGRGAHRDDQGRLVLHFGDTVLASAEKIRRADGSMRYVDPGFHGGYVYPAHAPIMRPHHEPVGIDAGQKVLKQLGSWSYKRQLLDPMLTLGAVMQSFLGGFVDWRAVMWVVGPRGTGKSTLDGEPSRTEGFIGHLIGQGRMNTANTSEAAIRQTLKNSTIPVFIDEIEPNTPEEKLRAVITLARIAAGGAKGHRGGQDQQAHEFTLRSPFWFSSILQPPLEAQDRSRIVTIELKKLRKDLERPDFFKMNAAGLGSKLLRRAIDQAVRLDETIARYREALEDAGHDARGSNVYGTLLACADLALYDDLPDEELTAFWATHCAPNNLSEIAEASSEERACLEHLLTSPVQARGGDEREALGAWVGKALRSVVDENEIDNTWQRRLMQMGIKLVNAKLLGIDEGADGEKRPRWGAKAYGADYGNSEPGWLAVAWKHRALDPLFGDTKWRGGVWRQALNRTEIAVIDAEGVPMGDLGAIDGVKTKMDRMSANCVLVPLCAVLDEDELPEASKAAAVAAWMAKVIG